MARQAKQINGQENFIDLSSLDAKLARGVQERAFGKGIALAAGFDLGAALPLDARVVANTIAERNEHVTGNRAYEGMQVYVIETKKNYQLVDGNWIETGVTAEQLESIHSAIDAAKAEVTKLVEAEATRAKAKEGELEASITALEEEHDDLEGRVSAAETKISANTSAIEGINSEITEVKADISAKGVAIEAVSGRVTTLEQAKTVSDKKITTLETGLAEEISRAKGEEARIEGLVTTEVNRAKAEENKIRGEFAAADTAMSEALTEKITEVSNKLTSGKAELQGKIDAVSAVAEQNKTGIAKVKEDLTQEIADRKAADQAQDVVIATKADKSYVDLELGKKAEKAHTHVMADITDLGTVAGLNVGNAAGQVPVLDEHGKLAMSTIPTLAINETKVVDTIEAAMALNQKAGDIVIINPASVQRANIVEKYNADQKNLAKGYEIVDVNVLNDEFAGYLAQGKTTFICVEPEADTFEERYRPLNSLADTMNKAEIQAELAKKDNIESVNNKVQGAKDYADNKISAAKTELSGAIDTAKTELTSAIEAVEGKADTNTAEIAKVKEAATKLKAVVDTHVADAVKHITAEERTSWNSRTKKVVASIGDAAAKEFEVAHNLESEDVMVTVKAADTKEVVFTDVKVKDENTIVVSFGMIPAENEFKVVVIG